MDMLAWKSDGLFVGSRSTTRNGSEDESHSQIGGSNGAVFVCMRHA